MILQIPKKWTNENRSFRFHFWNLRIDPFGKKVKKSMISCHAVPFPNKRSTRQQRCCQYQLSIFRKKQPKNKSLSQSNVNSQSLDPCSRLPSQGWTCSFPPSWSWLSPWTFASTKSCRKTSGSRPSSRNTKTSTDRHVCRPWNYGKNMSNT